MPNILWLSEINESDLGSVGAKAKSISELYQSGLTVPPAFCITNEALKYFLDSTGANSKESIIWSELPTDLRREIEEAYDNINIDPEIQGVNKPTFSLIKAGRDVPAVVVRISSGNVPEKSTILNIKGSKNLVNAVKKAWSIAYNGENLPSLIVQKMVSPTISGVLSFNDHEIVLKAIYGFLESRNLEQADTYRLDKDSLTLKNREKRIQEYKLVRDDMIDTIASRKVFSSDFKMGNNELRVVGSVGQRLQDEYGDKEVEFAIEGSKFYLLGVKEKKKEESEVGYKGNLPDLISPIPDTLLSFEPLKRDIPKIKEEASNDRIGELIEVKLGDIHIKVPKSRKSIEAAYKLLDAISSHLDE